MPVADPKSVNRARDEIRADPERMRRDIADRETGASRETLEALIDIHHLAS